MSKKVLKAVYDLLVERLGPPHGIEEASDRGPQGYEDALREAFKLAAGSTSRTPPMDIVSSAWWAYMRPELLEDIDFSEINPSCQGGAQYELFARAYLAWVYPESE